MSESVGLSYFAEKLAEADIPISALIVNRMHPPFTDALPEALRARIAKAIEREV